jgi:hypothetical protein
MAANWKRRFDEPIKLPDGRKLVTLKDAIAWLAKEVPASERGMKQVLAAAHCVIEAAENGGPMQFARICRRSTGTGPRSSTRNAKARIGASANWPGTERAT